MTRENLFEYVEQQYGISPEYPWLDSDSAVFRRTNNRKWFGIIQRVRRDRVGLDGDGDIDILNVKSEPLLIDSLLELPGFRPAYHMNKEKWISILVNDSVESEQIKSLIELSYCLTGVRRTRKK